MLIFLLTNVDKRLKFYKHWKDVIVEFEPLPEATLKKYIKKEIALSDKNCEKLIEVCASDYSRILLEIDKIKAFQAYCNQQTKIYPREDDCFNELLKQGVIYQPPKDAIFDYVDAVLKHEVNKAFDLLEQCYAVGESTIVLLSVLYTNIKQVLQVQSCKSNDISKSTGLTGWQIKCAKEKMGHYSIGDLVYMLKLVRDTEMRIKTGEIEEQMAVPYVMVNIF
jgi:DNA polymerase III delta subunit